MTPTIDSFSIRAYWGSCAEPLLQIVQKTTQMLTAFREIDSHFLKYCKGINRKSALYQKLSFDRESIRALCLANVKEAKLSKKGIAENGYVFGVCTGQRDAEASRILFVVGSSFHATGLSNSCIITLPNEGPARDRLLQPETSKRMLRTLVEIWSPDYAVLTSDSLRNKMNVRNEVGWITFKRNMEHVPEVENGITYERDEEGHWFYVKDIGDFANGVRSQLMLLKNMGDSAPASVYKLADTVDEQPQDNMLLCEVDSIF